MAVSILLGILALGFLIVVHEAGHYVVARWCSMRVERFSVGFGPAIPGLKHKARNGTTFQIAPIPFGGFVEIRGMNIAEEVDPEDVSAYPNRPAWQRFVTILAGPATNYLSAIALALGLYTCHGMAGSTYYVDDVNKGYDAVGKLLPGDRIIAVDGVAMYSPSTARLSKAVNDKRGAPITLTVWRGHGKQDIVVQPKPGKDRKGNPIWINSNYERCTAGASDCRELLQLGVALTPDIVDVSLATATREAFVYSVIQTKFIIQDISAIFSGKEDADPGGPVRIVGEFTRAFDAGWVQGIRLLMALSVYLALFNLLPLPALDGGRLAFLGYEMVTRRRANPKIETAIHMAGIMALMILMVLVTLHDLSVI